MIISASRRTDIPALYSDWLMNRLSEGYAYIPNPRNPDRIGRVELSPELVDCIVFWTKNPIPMMDKLDQLDEMGYRYYIQFTLTPYSEAVECNLPPKPELIQAFIQMSKRISSKRSVWRYDPIFIDGDHSAKWHVRQFSEMCANLSGFTERCILSFIDPYKGIGDKFRAMTQAEMLAIASGLSDVAKQHDITLYTCAEEIDLSCYGIEHSACIDQALIERIIGCRIRAKTDANQRAACRCIESVDIGAYDTCVHGCAYCYATSSAKTVEQRVVDHDMKASMLTGNPKGNEIITDRGTSSQKIDQLSLF